MAVQRLRVFICILAACCPLLPAAPPAASTAPLLKASPSKFIDGRLNDWTEPFTTLDRWAWRPEAGSNPVYGGSLDCSATVRTARDEKNLYLGIVVIDDIFKPAQPEALDTGDAVVVRISPKSKVGEIGTPVEIVFSFTSAASACLRDAAGKLIPASKIRLGTGRAVLPAPNPALPREDGKAATTSISKLWYELAIPWSFVPGGKPAGTVLPVIEMQVIDADGQGIRGRLKWRNVQR